MEVLYEDLVVGQSLRFSMNQLFLFQVSVLPPLASIFVTSIAAQLADNLIAKGVDTTVVSPTKEMA